MKRFACLRDNDQTWAVGSDGKFGLREDRSTVVINRTAKSSGSRTVTYVARNRPPRPASPPKKSSVPKKSGRRTPSTPCFVVRTQYE
jgi:hypothetical protein